MSKMEEWITRSGLLLGNEGIDKLRNSKVAIFGVGGVGGYVAEALARSGVGSFVLTDSDTVDDLKKQLAECGAAIRLTLPISTDR